MHVVLTMLFSLYPTSYFTGYGNVFFWGTWFGNLRIYKCLFIGNDIWKCVIFPGTGCGSIAFSGVLNLEICCFLGYEIWKFVVFSGRRNGNLLFSRVWEMEIIVVFWGLTSTWKWWKMWIKTKRSCRFKKDHMIHV